MMQYVISSVVLLILDFIWIGVFMGRAYHYMIPNIQNTNLKVRPQFAILAYALMVFGMCMFVVPNVRRGNLIDALVFGGSFGLVVYGIYDYTSASVLENWDHDLAMIDIIWGIFVYAIAAYIGSLFKLS